VVIDVASPQLMAIEPRRCLLQGASPNTPIWKRSQSAVNAEIDAVLAANSFFFRPTELCALDNRGPHKGYDAPLNAKGAKPFHFASFPESPGSLAMPNNECFLICKMIKLIRNQAKSLHKSLKHLSLSTFNNLHQIACRERFKHDSIVEFLGLIYRWGVVFNLEVHLPSNFHNTLNLRRHLPKIIDMVQCINGDNRVKVCIHVWHGLAFGVHKFRIIVIEWPTRLNVLINQRIKTVTDTVSELLDWGERAASNFQYPLSTETICVELQSFKVIWPDVMHRNNRIEGPII
jgi:hypothetical protein